MGRKLVLELDEGDATTVLDLLSEAIAENKSRPEYARTNPTSWARDAADSYERLQSAIKEARGKPRPGVRLCGAVFALRGENAPRSCALPSGHAGTHADGDEARQRAAHMENDRWR